MFNRRMLLVVLTVLVVLLTAKDMVRAENVVNTCIDDLVLDTITTGDDGVKRAILVYRGVTYKCAAGALVPSLGPVLKVNAIEDTGVVVLLLPSLKPCTIAYTL
jgi:hypothetical protein